jgi:hypothetical protein
MIGHELIARSLDQIAVVLVIGTDAADEPLGRRDERIA